MRKLFMCGVVLTVSLVLGACPSAVAKKKHQVTNSWLYNAQPPGLIVKSTKLYRGQICHQAPGKVLVLSATTKTSTDTDVTSGASYQYWMAIVDNLGRESPPSDCVTAVIP